MTRILLLATVLAALCYVHANPVPGIAEIMEGLDKNGKKIQEGLYENLGGLQNLGNQHIFKNIMEGLKIKDGLDKSYKMFGNVEDGINCVLKANMNNLKEITDIFGKNLESFLKIKKNIIEKIQKSLESNSDRIPRELYENLKGLRNLLENYNENQFIFSNITEGLKIKDGFDKGRKMVENVKDGIKCVLKAKLKAISDMLKIKQQLFQEVKENIKEKIDELLKNGNNIPEELYKNLEKFQKLLLLGKENGKEDQDRFKNIMEELEIKDGLDNIDNKMIEDVEDGINFIL